MPLSASSLQQPHTELSLRGPNLTSGTACEGELPVGLKQRAEGPAAAAAALQANPPVEFALEVHGFERYRLGRLPQAALVHALWVVPAGVAAAGTACLAHTAIFLNGFSIPHPHGLGGVNAFRGCFRR